MDILTKWREARASVMRKEFENAMAKAPGPEAPARSAFLNNITQTHATLLALYSAASPAERRVILRNAKNAATNIWHQGAWPAALGFEIACLNVASRFVPGADAAYVKAETAKIIEEAARSAKNLNGSFDRLAWMDGGAEQPASHSMPGRDRMGRERLRKLALEARQVKHAAFAEIADQALRLTASRHPIDRLVSGRGIW